MALNFPASPSDGDIYENFEWDAAIGVWQVRSFFQLNELQDVTTPSPIEGDLLYYDGTQWINAAPADINIGTSDENLSALFWMYA
jgi:hypothetical protein